MSYTNIDNPTLYFNTVLYTGNGSTQSITGVGFQPDFTWIKARSTTLSHLQVDSVRGSDKRIFSNLTNAELTTAVVSSFDSDGFSVAVTGGSDQTNQNSATFASWNWLAGGTASSNTDGSITSSVSANTTSGFSIVTWTGNGTNPSTIGHGLNQAPDVILLKNRDTSATNWIMYHSANTSAPETDYLILDSTNATADSASVWSDTAPTSSVFTVGSAGSVNNSGDAFITYCMHSVKGYSKFGSYTGNGSTDGTFVYTGFKPAWVMIKQTNTSGNDWYVYDNKRETYNFMNNILRPNTTDADLITTVVSLDFLSNGIKMRGTNTGMNGSGSSYIYMAFAENPFVTSTAVPTTAR